MKTLNQFLDESSGGGVAVTPQELEIQKKMSRLKEGDVHSGQGEKIQKRTKDWMDKKGQKGAPGLDAIRARAAEHKAKRGVKEDWKPEIEHSKLGDAKKKKDKERESKLPPHLQGDAIGKMKKAFATEEDKAFNFVVNKLKAKYGSGVMTKGDKMPEPSAAQKKKNAAIRAKRAKEDHRDPTEKASDGRYSDRYSNRGSD